MGWTSAAIACAYAWTHLMSPASASATTEPSNPTLYNHTLVGVALDPKLNRDSCASCAWGDRILWVCHDTTQYGLHGLSSSSASYSNMTATGPDIIPIPPNGHVADNYGYTDELVLYGNNNNEPFYVQSDKFCGGNRAAKCKNGDRYPRWAIAAPLVTSVDASGNITAYTWIYNTLTNHSKAVMYNPSTSLYKVTWSPQVQGNDTAVLPNTSFVSTTFWQAQQFGYGASGAFLVNDTAYLYANGSEKYTYSIARVAAADIEDISKYEYYVGGNWTTTMPASVNTTGARINFTANGVGTFYYWPAWSSPSSSSAGAPYVWLGGVNDHSQGKIYISVAAEPQGPWTSPSYLFTVPGGNTTKGDAVYAFQANPDLIVNTSSNSVYFSYTKTMSTGYQNPLYLVEFDPSP